MFCIYRILHSSASSNNRDKTLISILCAVLHNLPFLHCVGSTLRENFSLFSKLIRGSVLSDYIRRFHGEQLKYRRTTSRHIVHSWLLDSRLEMYHCIQYDTIRCDTTICSRALNADV